MTSLPDWARRARQGWRYTGQERPSFAETPGPGQESVWDYPRPPALEPDSREVVVRHGELEIARSRRAVRVLETASPPGFYIPAADVKMDLLRKAPGTSRCEWKGVAEYWSLRAAGASAPPVAWTYPAPFADYERIRGHLAFYPGRVECSVDGERVRSQPGGFYGGWVTSEIAGPVKGELGSSNW